MSERSSSKVAFVTGASGISGHSIIEHLVQQPAEDWTRIIVTSRRPLPNAWTDPRVTFVAIDFLDPQEKITATVAKICSDVTHAFFTSYVHSADFKLLPVKNIPLFRNFIDAVDQGCPKLQRVCLQTGGKHYGVHLGPVKVPVEETCPRYEDHGENFYYPQEDYLREVQARRKTWSYNVIRPNAIIGFSPRANGMSEILTIFLYMLVCRELGQPPTFPGNSTSWNLVDDNSYAPSLADLSVWAVSHDHCKDEAFNHVNGDVFIWKYIWQEIAAHLGIEVHEQSFEKTAGNTVDLVDWAKDKQAVWGQIVSKYGGQNDAFDWGTWDLFNWASGKSWPTISSMNKARKFGWTRYDKTLDTWIETYRAFEEAGVLPSRAALLQLQ
ncbi:hypothetical protein N7492_007256 [Penicillium capsulatum]|uniref:PRISE-like Rossmann-fold domain-containing protein n=1 Tax=Penicillium capsulatum TaxID=69766 RepID=A0A9W9HZE8_9EURO|nr:hypothetical protein N7492_007256 [Penicillium capsulatum]